MKEVKSICNQEMFLCSDFICHDTSNGQYKVNVFNIFILCQLCIIGCVLACSVVSDWDPMDCSLPGSSVHGIFQARIPEWVAVSSSRDLPNLGNRIGVYCVSFIGKWILTLSHLRSPYYLSYLKNKCLRK